MKRALGGGLLAASLTVMSLQPMTAFAAPLPQESSVSDRGTGLDLSAIQQAPAKPKTFGTMGASRIKAAPASADLSQYALPAGDQARTNSCVAWATGYSAYGIIMNRQNIDGAPMAPMFTYAQIARGNDNGTWAGEALKLQAQQGIDTKAHYGPGDYDFTTQPTEAERQNAAQYKLSGYEQLPTSGSAAKTAIMEAVAEGHPVPVGMKVYQNIYDVDARTASDYSYSPAGQPLGGHEVTIIGYNERGVKIANSWGADWGSQGFFTMSWDELINSGNLMESHAMGDIAGHPAPEPAPTDDPTADPTVAPTATPTTEPTVAPTDEPTEEPTVAPTTEPTVAPTDEPTEEPVPDEEDSWDDGWWDWGWLFDWSWSWLR